MNLTNINPTIPCRRMSGSTNSKSTYSLSSKTTTTTPSSTSKNSCEIPVLIQLCIHPDETYACRTMRTLLSLRYRYSPNVCDEFGCNVLMYTLRYQRYRLFELLLNETSFDLDLHAIDQQGNGILHYAILYGGDNTQIIDQLIVKYNQFAIEIDQRNNLGFTPLLLAAFSSRYDLVLTLLTTTHASPFVRDHIRFRNIFDYIDKDFTQISQPSIHSNLQVKCLRTQLYQTIPLRRETVRHHTYKNFFEMILPEAIPHQPEPLRLLLREFFHFQCLSSNFVHLLNYLNQRYPRIRTHQRQRDLPDNTIATQRIYQRDNSKTSVHHIFNLFDPNLRPKILPTKLPSIPREKPAMKKFKKLGTKITTLTAFSRNPIGRKRTILNV